MCVCVCCCFFVVGFLVLFCCCCSLSLGHISDLVQTMYEKKLICEIECCTNLLCVALGSGTFICNFVMKLVCEGKTLEICLLQVHC